MTSDLPLEMSRLSLEYVHQAEAERFWTPSEPYRLLNGATTDPATCHR